MKLENPIAYGRTAEIYPWRNDHVLKLFYDWFGLDDIEYELRMARAIHASGLPVPAAGEIVKINGRHGLIYQRFDGRTMLDVMLKKPWLGLRHARRMAELQASMHDITIQANIPGLYQKLIYKINQATVLPPHVRTKILASLEKMPEGNRLCHGDFHPGNIMLSEKGETVIDWIDASLGNPLADVARTTIISLGAVATGQMSNPLIRLIIRVIHREYLAHYFTIRPGGKVEYKRWLPIIAAARLSENIQELEVWLIDQTKTVS